MGNNCCTIREPNADVKSIVNGGKKKAVSTPRIDFDAITPFKERPADLDFEFDTPFEQHL